MTLAWISKDKEIGRQELPVANLDQATADLRSSYGVTAASSST